MKKGISINLKGKVLIILISALLACLITYTQSVYTFNKTHTKIDNTKTSNSSNACKLGYNEIAELIIDNPWAHNSIFRGKDVTNYYTDGSLFDRIKGANGYNIFDDLYVGDYITATSGGKTINWRIAGFDMYMNKGDGGDSVAPLAVHHAVIVPDTSIINAQMNPLDENNQNYTTGGYVGSQMYTTTLPTVLSTYIEPVFGTHILTYRNLLTTETTSGRISRYGTNNGASSNWAWQTRKLDLMNENQIMGSIGWSSSGYETGSDNIQFPLFRLKPEFVNKEKTWTWLRNILASTGFTGMANGGNGSRNASISGGVRPYFYID